MDEHRNPDYFQCRSDQRPNDSVVDEKKHTLTDWTGPFSQMLSYRVHESRFHLHSTRSKIVMKDSSLQLGEVCEDESGKGI